MFDGIHPEEDGEVKMVRVWFNGLDKILSDD